MWVRVRNRVSGIDFGEDAEIVIETLVSQRCSVYGAKAQLRTLHELKLRRGTFA